jgi:hypothetical protein
MLRIERGYVEGVRAARRPEELYEMVQKAIELEHATIPAYLCAYFTLKAGTNQTVGEIIRSVVIEEMLHMSIASNLLIAIGGAPVINKPGFIPVYPGPLPMGIADGLIVSLEKCSIPLVRETFMEIEKPEHPLEPSLAERALDYNTIGEFYAALDDKLKELGQGAFIGDFSREMVDNSWFPNNELFRITGPKDASRAIEIIIRQGEGTSTSIEDPNGAAAHYYRFQQIVEGRLAVVRPGGGFSFSGASVVLDERNVWNMRPNPDPDKLPQGSRARQLAIEFANAYTSLLNALHETFNGEPASINRAMGVMYELRLLARKVLETPEPDANGKPTEFSTGLSFRYQPHLS